MFITAIAIPNIYGSKSINNITILPELPKETFKLSTTIPIHSTHYTIHP